MSVSKLFISAGEVSGDIHAATVVAELIRRHEGVLTSGVTGTHMQAAGCAQLFPMSDLNVMGITDVLPALPRIWRIEKAILAWCKENQPEAAILVDFSSFHMRLGRKIRALGIPVLHFIAPKLWAWGKWRVRKLSLSQDSLACILPFEPAWFAAHGIAARYVGNPSAVACTGGWSKAELKKQLGLKSDQFLMAILPGSRNQEIRLHVPLLAASMQRLKQLNPNITFVVPVAPGVNRDALELLWQAGALPVERSQVDYALRVDAAIAVSGTATLELALWDVPNVLIYRASPVTMFIGQRLVSLNCVGLANIILDDQMVIPELIQQDCTVDHIVEKTRPLLHSESVEASWQRSQFELLRERLGDLSPAVGAADMLDELVAKKRPGD